MVWPPTRRLTGLQLAPPEVSRGMAPPHNRVLPSRKVRPPVGVPPAEVTAAVKVSAAPPVEGLLLKARVVRVVAR